MWWWMVLLATALGVPSAVPEAATPAPTSPPGVAARPAAAHVTTLDFDRRGRPETVAGQAPGWEHQYLGRQARIVSSPSRDGGHAIRFTLTRKGRHVSGPRAELAGPEQRGEAWYGFSVYLSRSWARDREPDIVTQWHGTGRDGGDESPPLSIETQNGQWVIGRNPDAHYSDTPVGRYRTGRWTDWVVHVRWASDRRGFLTIWRDGRRIIDTHHVQTAYTHAPPVYLKIGIYKWPWDDGHRSDVERRTMVEDQVRIAGADGSYAAVRPRPTPPRHAG